MGYHEGRSGGHWNNKEKYAAQVPGLAWVSDQGQPWCAVFVSWLAMKAGLADLYPRTASTDLGASWFKQNGQWSEYPAIGAQVFYGRSGDMNHTGIVAGFDNDFIHTIEGNTNDSGSAEGDGVYAKIRRRNDDYIQGYGYPAVPGGLVSADPSRQPAPQPPAPSKPTLVERIRKQLTKAVQSAKPGSRRQRKLREARADLPKK